MPNYNYVIPQSGKLPAFSDLNHLVKWVVKDRLPHWSIWTLNEKDLKWVIYRDGLKPEYECIFFYKACLYIPEQDDTSDMDYLKNISGKYVNSLAFEQGPVSGLTRFVNDEIRQRVCQELESYDYSDTSIFPFPAKNFFSFYETFWDKIKVSFVNCENLLEDNPSLKNKLTYELSLIGEAPKDIYDLLGLPEHILIPFLTASNQEARVAAKKALER